MTTEQARATHTELNSRLLELRASLAANIARRSELAFDCETGDVNARREAASLVKAAPALEEDIRRLEAAVVEAARRVAGAEATDRDEAERERAQKALALLERFSKRGAALDAAFDAAVAEYEALGEEFRALDALGFAPTTFALVKANMQRAAATKLMFTDLQDSFLAPHERRNFVASIQGWASHVKARAEGRLNRKSANAA